MRFTIVQIAAVDALFGQHLKTENKLGNYKRMLHPNSFSFAVKITSILQERLKKKGYKTNRRIITWSICVTLESVYDAASTTTSK